MNLDEFRKSLDQPNPPAGLTQALAGLWWVHAYLHRKEGDQSNAAYWYGRAGKPVCREPLDAEWLSILKDLLG